MDANSACKVTENPGKIRKTQMRILIKLSPEVIIRMKKLLSCCLKTASALPEIFQHLVRYDSIILRLYFIVHTSCPKFLFKRFKKHPVHFCQKHKTHGGTQKSLCCLDVHIRM